MFFISALCRIKHFSRSISFILLSQKRLALWKEGNLEDLISEGDEIQRRMKPGRKTEESLSKGFTRLMLSGNVRQAVKLLDANDPVNGVHEVTEDVRKTLLEKHPKGKDAQEGVLDDREIPRIEKVIFEEIDEVLVQRAAKALSGYGGPNRIDSEIWKQLLCSRAFGKLSDGLANAIAAMARLMCTEEIPFDHLHLLMDCHLVPLRKGKWHKIN